jgi:ABC-type multidrug transport system fused ATPase/permease subunit
MKRSYLLEDLHNSESLTYLNLDSPVDDGGENLSVGQQSLVALARALVKDCKIIVLDEASASLDLETDAKIRDTIISEFADRTLLCIAHRLRTVIGYDRILVLDSGEVLEFDDPLTLFRKDGPFHAMCTRSSITEADIVKAQAK